MNYKYSGKKFDIRLNDEGKIECAELGIIRDTVEECKVAIREETEKEKKMPKVPVLFFERYGDKEKAIEGFSTMKSANTGRYRSSTEVWVAWKDKNGSTKRQKMYASSIYKDTPENRAALNKYADLKEKESEIHNAAYELLETVETIEDGVVS